MRYVFGLLIIFALAGCGVTSPETQQAALDRAFATVNAGLSQSAGPAVRVVTINGHDAVSGELIDPVNVWKSYTDRSGGIVARLHDGDKVTMLQRVGQGVKIRTGDGTEGWVTYFFIKELE